MDLIIFILIVMLLWNLIKMVKAQTNRINGGNKHHKRH